MNNKILKILVLVLFFLKIASAQNPFPKQIAGYWINAEYERMLGESMNEKIASFISPQFLYFDTLGNCTVQTEIEHRLFIGKSIGKRKFGNALQFVYSINKIKFAINEIEGDDKLLYVSFTEISVGMLFKKYLK